MTMTEFDDASTSAAPRSVHGVFAERACATPNAVAVESDKKQTTYAELDQLSDCMARFLRSRGVTPQVPVGVLLERSTTLVVALLGILKAGGAYVALDPRDPPERLATIVQDAGIKLVLTEENYAQQIPGSVTAVSVHQIPMVPDHGPRQPQLAPDASGWTAYVAYTSGSTGTPRGVCIPHRAILRLAVNPDFIDVGPDDVFLHAAPTAFDASTFEIWVPLLNGARLVMAPTEQLSPVELTEFVRRGEVSVLWLTAGLFHQVVNAGLPELPALRFLLAGGDVLSLPHVNRALAALPGTQVVNGYGPTENTTFTCCHHVRAPIDAGTVPIGQPIRGTSVFILDQDLKPVPPGEVGTLYAAGAGLADGYLGQPGLTAMRFLPNPFAGEPGARMYDTGDLVRQLANDAIEFIGRSDEQVKIRGFRVELGEIETALQGLPDVRNAVLVPRRDNDGGLSLSAFYESDVPMSAPEVRKGLAAVLPPYMLPATLTWLDSLPLTHNGKVDRAALASRRTRERPDVDRAYRAPTGDVEIWLTSLWEEVMDIDGIGVDDELFELGGHSLLATRITSAVSDRYGILLKARTFYQNPTIAGTAAAVASLLVSGVEASGAKQ